MAEDVEDGFLAFCRRLADSLANLTAALRRSIGDAIKESMASLGEILASFETRLIVSFPNIAGRSIIDQ